MDDVCTAAGLSQKEKDQLDKKLKRLEDKIFEAKHKYDDLLSQYSELLELRHPEKKEERIKETLYRSYLEGGRSLDQVLAYMSGEDPDEW